MIAYSLTFPSIEDEDTFLTFMQCCAMHNCFMFQPDLQAYDSRRRKRVVSFAAHADARLWRDLLQEVEELRLFNEPFVMRLEKNG